MNDTLSTYENFRSIMRATDVEILDMIKNQNEIIWSKMTSIRTRNHHFIAFFNLGKESLLKNEFDKESEFTKDVLYSFMEIWRTFDNASSMHFFDNNEPITSGFRTLDMVYKKHQKIITEINDTSDLCPETKKGINLDKQGILEMTAKYCAWDQKHQIVSSMEIEDSLMIHKAITHIKSSQANSVFVDYSKLKNDFNLFPVDQLVAFFSILKETPLNYTSPLITNKDFDSLIKSICKNEILKTPFKLNLKPTHYSPVRRLFYDFYVKCYEFDYNKKSKIECLRFLENFQHFKGKTQNENWIKDTIPTKQRTTLAEFIKNGKIKRKSNS